MSSIWEKIAKIFKEKCVENYGERVNRIDARIRIELDLLNKLYAERWDAQDKVERKIDVYQNMGIAENRYWAIERCDKRVRELRREKDLILGIRDGYHPPDIIRDEARAEPLIFRHKQVKAALAEIHNRASRELRSHHAFATNNFEQNERLLKTFLRSSEERIKELSLEKDEIEDKLLDLGYHALSY